ncbi:MAG: hypothetical protein JXA38_06880 [Methanosarcinaceae archaeon]|nr:hypothetical protein [Methanosarcinaceae archaeon]
MDPYKISPQKLIDKGIYIEIPEDITFQEYKKIFGEFANNHKMIILGIGIPNKTYFYSPKCLDRLFSKYEKLTNAIVDKRIENLRLKLDHFIITEEQRKKFAAELVEKHTKNYLEEEAEQENSMYDESDSSQDYDKIEIEEIDEETDEDYEIPSPSIEDILDEVDLDESIEYRLFIDPAELKSWMAEEDDIRYYIIKNEYDNLDDHELLSSRFFEIIYQITLDRKVLCFVREELDLESTTLKEIKSIIEEKQEKLSDKSKRRIMLLNEFAIIDHIDNHLGLQRNYNKIGRILKEFFDLDINADTLRKYIEAIKKPSTTNKQNNPYNYDKHTLWLEAKLNELKLLR